ncbi:hypothetical protein ONZ45_g9141 [Pleurotus djamor]|nr:hypothetical protein ONZ45_g9141 [Pleurotus djamor]
MILTFLMSIDASQTVELDSKRTDQTYGANKVQDVAVQGISGDTAMEVDYLPSFYYTSYVRYDNEAQATLKVALNIMGNFLREADLGMVVIEYVSYGLRYGRPVNSFWSDDKRGLIYASDHIKTPMFAIYVTQDGVGSVFYPFDSDKVKDKGNEIVFHTLNQFYISYSAWY